MAPAFVLLLVVFSSMCSAIYVQNLNGQWIVSCARKGISVTGQVPGSMYTALIENKHIKDPLYRDNDVKLAWIGHENWTYTRYFQVSSAMAQSQSVLLVAEGIDTVSTVFINGRAVMGTDNMFIKYTLDVKPFVKPGNNTIQLSFQSATDFAKKQADTYPYTVPPTCTLPVQHGECHVNFIRKEQCSFSWDWGPSFPTQGIWKPIYLKAFDSAVIDMATVEVAPDSIDQGWELRTKTFFNVNSRSPVTGQLQIKLDGTSIAETHSVTLTSASNMTAFNISVPKSAGVKQWWPNGYGKQTLYNVYFVFTAANGEVTSQRRRIGFRTIELVQDPVSALPQQGLTFYFKVNGFPIFMKGSNWIPADSFQERITKDRLRLLLQSAVDTHMNAMRVWGGGVFESEDFYDLTDELGILIWQDLMFSVALYSTHQPFLDTVTEEVTYQVRRLVHRPSILVWTGNNENSMVLPWFGISNYTLYYDDYVKLYVSTIMPIMQAENPNRVYLTSSPSDGKETVKEGYVAKDPGSQLYGDIHFYDYGMDQWKADRFRIPRFASEYGIEAWCNYETLKDVFEDSDMSYCSPQADHRQHHTGGDTEMEMEIMKHLTLPPSGTPEPLRFKNFIYLTQINQAMSVKSQTEHYRRHQGSLQDDGRGLTMGALYWQLNDIWQAPTWASIDYSGRWKMLQYYALDFFNPVLVSPFLDGFDINIFVVVDQIPTVPVRDPHGRQLTFEPMSQFKDILNSSVERENVLDLTAKVGHDVNGVVTIEMYNWNNFQALHRWTVPYKLNTTAESIFKQGVGSMMSEAGCSSKKDCFIYTYVNDPTAGINNWIYLAELKDSNLQKAQVTIVNVHQDSDRDFSIDLATTAIAPFVWLEAGSIMGRFSTNGFLMVKPTTMVKFTAWKDVDFHTLHNALTVGSLMEVYGAWELQ
ncbi:beta-mannosidase-like isoform X2 [Littorina saxatilis]|uniref:beta-mannosidase-like isoform X2 n=1 Tax=Littorina saxatilis TaxID=31220 RepID=UPI0038B62E64